MALRWEQDDRIGDWRGWDDRPDGSRWLGANLVPATGRWLPIVRNNRIGGDTYASVEEAQAAAQAVFDRLPQPVPPRPRERRRYVKNRWPGLAPHPGVLREPPKD